MARKTDANLRGFGILDPRWVPGNLSDTYASVTQEGPYPGDATSDDANRGTVQMQGAQTDGLVFRGTLNAGNPDQGYLGAGLSFYTDDAVDDGLTSARHWKPILRTTGNFCIGKTTGSKSWTDAAASKLSGRIVHSHTGGYGHAWIPGTDQAIRVSPGSLSSNGVIQRTEPGGSAWESYAAFPSLAVQAGSTITKSFGYERKRLAFDGSGNLLFIGERDDGTRRWDAFASSDLGASWTYLGDTGVLALDIAEMPDGRIAATWTTSTLNWLSASVLGSAYDFESLLAGTRLPLGPNLWQDCTIGVDDDNVIWLFARNAGDDNRWDCWYSIDGGDEYERADNPLHSTTGVEGSETFRGPKLVFSHGVGHFFYGQEDETFVGDEDADGVILLGGWQGPIFEYVSTSPEYDDRLYWNTEADGYDPDLNVVFYNEPQNLAGHSFSNTTTGTGAVVAPMNVSASAYSLTFGVEYQAAIGDTAFTTGTATVPTLAVDSYLECAGQTNSDDPFCVAEVRTTTRHWRVEMTQTSWRIYDVAAGAPVAGGTVVHGVGATGWVEFQILQDDADLTILWRANDMATAGFNVSGVNGFSGGFYKGWQTTPSRWNKVTRTLTGSGSYTSQVRYGFITAPTTGTFQGQVTYLRLSENLPTLVEGVNTVGAYGKSLNSEFGYPIPDASDQTNDIVARAVARGGPFFGGDTGDELTVDPAYNYPVDAVFPTYEPSPAVTWRSTAKGVTQDIAVEVDAASEIDTIYGGDLTLALCVRGANVRQVELHRRDKGGSFTKLATLDLAAGFAPTDGLDYVRVGDTVYPGPASSEGARFIRSGELVGGHVILDPGGVPIRRKIVANTGGYWAPTSTTNVRARIRLEGVDDAGDPSSGDIAIVWPAGVVYYHETIGTGVAGAQYLVRIDSAQESPDDYYELGDVGVYGVRVPGKQWSHGWEWTMSPNVRVDTDPYGTQRRTQLGPSGRSWQLTWGDGQKDDRIRSAASSSDHLGSSVGDPAAVQDDVWSTLEGILIATEGGALPVLVCTFIPDASDVTITDPTLWMAGYIEGQWRVQEAAGRSGEGVDTYYRAGPMRVVERV